MTRAARFAAVLAEHRAALREVVHLAAASADPFLHRLADKARRRMITLARVEARPDLSGTVSGYDDLGTWGMNGKLPQSLDWAASARVRTAGAAPSMRRAA